MPKLWLFTESCCCLLLFCVPFSQLSFSFLPHPHPLAQHPGIKNTKTFYLSKTFGGKFSICPSIETCFLHATEYPKCNYPEKV